MGALVKVKHLDVEGRIAIEVDDFLSGVIFWQLRYLNQEAIR